MKTREATRPAGDQDGAFRRWFNHSLLPAKVILPAIGLLEEPRQNYEFGKTILVVDDDPVTLKAISMKLSSAGYAVCPAVDGAEAISIVRRQKPELILMDIN